MSPEPIMFATPAQLEAARKHGETSARGAASWCTTDPVKAKIALRTLARKSATRAERAAATPARPTIVQVELAGDLGLLDDDEPASKYANGVYDELGAAWTEGVDAAFLPACKQRLEGVIGS